MTLLFATSEHKTTIERILYAVKGFLAVKEFFIINLIPYKFQMEAYIPQNFVGIIKINGSCLKNQSIYMYKIRSGYFPGTY